jgi:hypothetical protein
VHQSGGAIAKLLVFLLMIVVLASAGLYVYGSRQQPLSIGALTPAPANAAGHGSVQLDGDGLVRVATVLHNIGRLPVTIEGVAASSTASDPLIVTSLGLGDGTDATAAATFAPAALDPGSGVGIVVTLGVNPDFPCDHLRADTRALPLPPIPVRFSSYGVGGTQAVVPDQPPIVIGLTPAACGAAQS